MTNNETNPASEIPRPDTGDRPAAAHQVGVLDQSAYAPAGGPENPNSTDRTAPGPEVAGPVQIPAGLTYPETLAVPRPRAWRGVAALLCFGVGFFMLSLLFTAGAVILDTAQGKAFDPSAMSPTMFAATMLSLALLTPLSMLLQKVFFKVPVGSLFSVAGRFRWGVLGRAALVVVPVWAVYVLVSLWAPQPGQGTAPTSELGLMLAISLLVVPLQSAGEEVGFRGLINRVAASWGVGPRSTVLIGGAVSSVLFCLAHGAGDPWLIAYYFAFGASLAVIAWRTGGVEVSVLVHAVNNCLLFVAMSITRTPANFDRSNGTGGLFMLLPIGLVVATAAVTWWLTRTAGPMRSGQPTPARSDRSTSAPSDR